MRQLTGMICFVTIATALCTPQQASAQLAVATPGYRYTNSTYQSLNWLFNPRIAKELEIVPEQTEKLTEIRKEMQEETRGLYKSFAELDPKERQKKYWEAYRESREKTEKKVNAVLVAQQVDRLKQIMLQMRLRSSGYGSASALSGGDVADALGLTDEQKKALQKREAEWRVEMREKTQEFYKKLQAEGREKLFEVLTDEQRKKLDKLTGKEFQWQATTGRGGASGNAKVQQLPKKK